MKKFLVLLSVLILLLVAILFSGCDTTNPTKYTCVEVTDVAYVKLRESEHEELVVYRNVEKVEIRNDSGVVYIYLEYDNVIITSLDRVIIKCIDKGEQNEK